MTIVHTEHYKNTRKSKAAVIFCSYLDLEGEDESYDLGYSTADMSYDDTADMD